LFFLFESNPLLKINDSLEVNLTNASDNITTMKPTTVLANNLQFFLNQSTTTWNIHL